MATTSEGDGVQASESGQQGNGALRPDGGYMLPWRVRKLCVYTAIFVAYSQFVSIGLLFLHRYQSAWDYGRHYTSDGYLNQHFLVLSVLLPGGEIGLKQPYVALFTLSAAALIVPHGCAGLFVAAFARRGWHFVTLVLFGSFVTGLAAAVVAFGLQAFVAMVRSFSMNIDEPYEFFPMHGVLEFAGGTVVPAAAYLALILWLVNRLITSRVAMRRG